MVNSRLYTAYHFLITSLHYVDPSDICHRLLSQWLYRSICMLFIVTINITRWGAHIRVIWADLKWECRLYAPSLSHNLPKGFPQLETSYASIDFDVRSPRFINDRQSIMLSLVMMLFIFVVIVIIFPNGVSKCPYRIISRNIEVVRQGAKLWLFGIKCSSWRINTKSPITSVIENKPYITV